MKRSWAALVAGAACVSAAACGLDPLDVVLVCPAALELGDVAVGSVERRALVCHNIGAAEAPSPRAELRGTGDAFSISAPADAVGPGAELVVQVAFAPRFEGSHAAELLVAGSGENTPVSVAVHGSGVPARDPIVFIDGGVVLIDGGATPIDGGVVLLDGGVVRLDGGVVPIDGGATFIDGGVVRIDGGAVPIDGGVAFIDGGVAVVDGGAVPIDGGVRVVDGGVAFIDGGVAFIDGGVAFIDGGASFIDGGASFIDGGASFIDGGAVPIEDGAAFIDGGVAFIDGGVVPIDGGATFIDGGVVPIDGGATFIDGGVVPIDGGELPIDGGELPIDGGVAFIDGGVVPIDGGAIPIDGGAVPIDGGVAFIDGGVVAIDGGVAFIDGGVGAPMDAGVVSVDGGVVPIDGGTLPGCTRGILGLVPTGPEVRVTASPVQTMNRRPSLAYTGSELGVLYEEPAAGGFDVRLQRVAGDGSGLIGAPVTVATAFNRASTSLAWTGARWAASWRAGLDLLVRFLATDGSPASAPVTVVRSAIEMEIAPAADGVAVVWTLNRTQIWLRHVHLDETQTTPVMLASGTAELGPSIVWNGSGHGLAWRSDRDQPGSLLTTQVYFARTSALGTEIGQETSMSPSFTHGCFCDDLPSQGLGWNGAEYALVHEDALDALSFTRIGADGRSLGRTLLPRPFTGWQGALAWTGSDWIVAYTDTGGLRITAVSALGAAVGTSLIVSGTGGGFARMVPVAGGQVVVVWSDSRGGTNDIYARRYALCR